MRLKRADTIVSSTSPDDSLALLLAMYAIFELNFPKNSRTIRLLYAIVFSDKRFLSTSIRNFMQEKQIDISLEQNRNKSNSASLTTDNPTTTTTKHVDPQSISQDKHTSSLSCSSTNANVSSSIVDNDSQIDTNIDSHE